MRIQTNQQNINIKAKPLAQWRCKSALNNTTKNITIVSLEKKDADFINIFEEKYKNFFQNDSIKQEIFNIIIKTIKGVFESYKTILNKAKILIAIHEDKPCGILIGNIPKIDTTTKTVLYSSRHNCGKNETELDWLITWPPNKNDKINGIGKALIGEYFNTVKKDKFKDVLVKSEVPENSYAQHFYESLGFKTISPKRESLIKRTSRQYVIENHAEANDEIIPMIITKKKIGEVLSMLNADMNRQEFIEKSINIENLIEL